MIIAAGKPGRVELVADGNETVLLRDNEMSLLVGERTFKITRKGFFGPTYQLWLGEDLVVSLAQTPGPYEPKGILRGQRKRDSSGTHNWHFPASLTTWDGHSYEFHVQMETQGRIDRGIFSTGLEV